MEELELFKQSTERAEVEVSSLKQSLSELEARMVETTAAHDTTLTEVKESAAEEVKFIKADQEIALRDLQVGHQQKVGIWPSYRYEAFLNRFL